MVRVLHKFLPLDLSLNSFSCHDAKMHFLNHDLFRLYILCSRLRSSVPSMDFLNVFRTDSLDSSRALHAGGLNGFCMSHISCLASAILPEI